jgi:THO complex subunit 1
MSISKRRRLMRLYLVSRTPLHRDMGSPAIDTPRIPDFYSTLWSLQKYFSHPPCLQGGSTGNPSQTPWEDFKEKSEIVLPKLFEQTQKERDLLGKEDAVPSGRKRKRDDEGFFHPRYLTGRRLLEHEVGALPLTHNVYADFIIS